MLNETKEELPKIEKPDQLYNYYADMRTPKVTSDILKDIPRTESTNSALNGDFKEIPEYGFITEDYKALFRVLNAYSHYDREVGYVQGMAFIANWVLKMMREIRITAKGMTLEHNEVNSFYILVHIMQCLGWRRMSLPGQEMLVHHLEIIEANLNSGAPAVYQHMLDELEEVNLYPVFSSKLMSVFTRDLAECYPKT